MFELLLCAVFVNGERPRIEGRLALREDGRAVLWTRNRDASYQRALDREGGGLVKRQAASKPHVIVFPDATEWHVWPKAAPGCCGGQRRGLFALPVSALFA